MLYVTKSAMFSATSLLMMLLLVPEIVGTGQIEVWFLSYSSNCEQDTYSECDPYFSFCMGSPQSARTYFEDYFCNYGKTPWSTSYTDAKYLYLADKTSIGGLANPWIITTDNFYDPTVIIAVDVNDDDTLKIDDHIVLFYSSFPVTVAQSKNQAQWSSQTLREGLNS
ncbi:uncharacterized protein LOC131949948 [Physella acuta]|uniref:uncharacterized protein LOC131949948 n=1 Tax=Physella acuta TaxID=109671 RepID=UPI0027DE802D|nr:uncharacterized protein LOC131949948 [Physella acuta]